MPKGGNLVNCMGARKAHYSYRSRHGPKVTGRPTVVPVITFASRLPGKAIVATARLPCDLHFPGRLDVRPLLIRGF